MSIYQLGSKGAIAIVMAAGAVSHQAVAEEASQGKVELFNGKDLTGWKVVGGNGEFKVEDGCIVGFGKNIRGNTFLRTEKTYKDFEFCYEFKFDDLSGNSGVMFRANQKPSDDGNGRVFGYQCEACNTKGRAWTAGIFDEARRGWLYPVKKGTAEQEKVRDAFTEQGKALFKWDDWNTITIRCEGNRIQTWLNGEKRADFTDEDKKHDTREGFFGLQVHGGKSCNVRWRNLTLKAL
ncbi:3-keto-disaccharide hydrolase [Rubritalea tangerina]|uniref:DUF1080 domain-containing protein n=1 Tax=Rubritalea tangerina TaxID=430798 RepID=A0ABW4Z795_9BACT